MPRVASFRFGAAFLLASSLLLAACGGSGRRGDAGPDSPGSDGPGSDGPPPGCADGDGVCPAGCASNDDDDCAAICGNGLLEAGEACETGLSAPAPGACPTACDDASACTVDSVADPGTCDAVCVFASITACANDDDCCPSGCNAASDDDCSATCGNGVVETPERCEPTLPSGNPGACPTSCDDGMVCTTDALQNAGTCDAHCSVAPITACSDSDACCPSGCNANGDDDCDPICGNGVVEPGETCDGDCPTSCADTNACTTDVTSGSPTLCNVQCGHVPITFCAGGDGCCLPGCNRTGVDGDCPCGDGDLDPGEQCDLGAGNSDTMPDTCRMWCTLPTCGDGVADTGELCDDGMNNGGEGMCLPGCDDMQMCGDGDVEGTEQCDLGAGNSDTTPDTCRTDCFDARCGDGVLDAGEECDPPVSTGTGCSDDCQIPEVVTVALYDGCVPGPCSNDLFCAVRINVTRTDPIILRLSAYDVTTWRVNINPSANVVRLEIHGYEPQYLHSTSRLSGTPLTTCTNCYLTYTTYQTCEVNL